MLNTNWGCHVTEYPHRAFHAMMDCTFKWDQSELFPQVALARAFGHNSKGLLQVLFAFSNSEVHTAPDLIKTQKRSWSMDRGWVLNRPEKDWCDPNILKCPSSGLGGCWGLFIRYRETMSKNSQGSVGFSLQRTLFSPWSGCGLQICWYQHLHLLFMQICSYKMWDEGSITENILWNGY